MDKVENGILPVQRLFCFPVALCISRVCYILQRCLERLLSSSHLRSQIPNGKMKMLPSIVVMTKSVFPWKLERKMVTVFLGYVELKPSADQKINSFVTWDVGYKFISIIFFLAKKKINCCRHLLFVPPKAPSLATSTLLAGSVLSVQTLSFHCAIAQHKRTELGRGRIGEKL